MECLQYGVFYLRYIELQSQLVDHSAGMQRESIKESTLQLIAERHKSETEETEKTREI